MSEFENKYHFIEKEVRWLCMVINEEVIDVYYSSKDDNEWATIRFADGSDKKISVAGKNLKEIALSVIKEI